MFELLPPASNAMLWIFLPMCVFLLLLIGFFGYTLYGAYHSSVEVTDNELVINVPFYGRSIPLNELDIAGAERISLSANQQAGPSFGHRTNGMSVPGYRTGWYKLKNGRKALLALSSKERVVLIPGKGDYDVMLSVRDPEAFMLKLQQAQ